MLVLVLLVMVLVVLCRHRLLLLFEHGEDERCFVPECLRPEPLVG